MSKRHVTHLDIKCFLISSRVCIKKIIGRTNYLESKRIKWKESCDHVLCFNEVIKMLTCLQTTIVDLSYRERSFMISSHRASLKIFERPTWKRIFDKSDVFLQNVNWQKLDLPCDLRCAFSFPLKRNVSTKCTILLLLEHFTLKHLRNTGETKKQV